MDISADDKDSIMPLGQGGLADSTDEEDRINLLPEGVLIHILSFLPTIEAVRTCIVTKKWRYLWKSIHTLFLDLDSIQHFFKSAQVLDTYVKGSKKRKWEVDEKIEIIAKNKFNIFMNNVGFLLHEANIRKVRLCTRYKYESIDIWNRTINVLISAAVTRKVQEVELVLDFNNVDSLAPCLFVNETLKDLTLNLYGCELKLPDRMCFNGLKTLHLASVILCDENLVGQLFSSTPVLENLIVENCGHGHNFSVLGITSPSLKSLVVKTSDDVNVNNDLSTCVFKISTPTLKFFTYKGFVAREYKLEEFSSVVCTDIHCYSACSKIEKSAVLLREVLDASCAVEVLKICGICIKALSPPPDHFGCPSIPFYHLRHLELSMSLIGNNLQVIIGFINTNPDLHTLVINLQVPEDGGFEYYSIHDNKRAHSWCESKTPDDKENKEKYLGVLKLSPRKILQNLRNVKVNKIGGELEIEFLKYLLETQMFLDRLIINFARYRKGQEKIGEELLGFPRASPSLAVKLS